MPGADDKPPGAKPGGPKVLFGSPTPPTPKGNAVKVLFGGEIRRRIPCTVAELQKLDASATKAFLDRALRIVEGVNLDDRHFDDVVRYGADLQAEHGALMESELALAQDEALVSGQTLSARALALFEKLDPDTVFAIKGKSFIEAIQSLAVPARSAERVFGEQYPKLLSLVEELKKQEPRLIEAANKLAALSPRYTSLIERIAGYVLAARFIAGYVRTKEWNEGERAHYASQADALETRAASLLATQVTLEAGRLTHEMLQAGAQSLVDAGRGLSEENLPAYQTAFAAAIAKARQGPVSRDASWLKPLRDIHARILKKLNPAKENAGAEIQN